MFVLCLACCLLAVGVCVFLISGSSVPASMRGDGGSVETKNKESISIHMLFVDDHAAISCLRRSRGPREYAEREVMPPPSVLHGV